MQHQEIELCSPLNFIPEILKFNRISFQNLFYADLFSTAHTNRTRNYQQTSRMRVLRVFSSFLFPKNWKVDASVRTAPRFNNNRVARAMRDVR